MYIRGLIVHEFLTRFFWTHFKWVTALALECFNGIWVSLKRKWGRVCMNIWTSVGQEGVISCGNTFPNEVAGTCFLGFYCCCGQIQSQEDMEWDRFDWRRMWLLLTSRSTCTQVTQKMLTQLSVIIMASEGQRDCRHSFNWAIFIFDQRFSLLIKIIFLEALPVWSKSHHPELILKVPLIIIKMY